MNITADECAVCGSTLEEVRPGKWQCTKCELDQMMQEEIDELREYIVKQAKEVSVMREALGQIAYAKLMAYHCEDIAKEALKKVGGEG